MAADNGNFLDQLVSKIFQLFQTIVDACLPPPPWLSATLLIIIVVGFLFILFVIASNVSKKNSEQKQELKYKVKKITGDNIESLRKEIDDLHERIDEKDKRIDDIKSNPDFDALEVFYFNANGVANSCLILGIGLLLWEYYSPHVNIEKALSGMASLSAANKLKIQSAVDMEISWLMGALAMSILVSGVLVLLAGLRKGRSLQIINRAFLISLVISAVALFVFAVASPASK